MKSASPALATHLAGEATTLATLWRVVRRDGAVFTFTDHDRDIVYGGETYACALGYQRAAISAGAELAVDETELLGLLDSSAIDPAELRAGLWDHAEVRIFAVNWASLEDGELKLRRGRLGEVIAQDDGSFRAELRGLAQPLQQTIQQPGRWHIRPAFTRHNREPAREMPGRSFAAIGYTPYIAPPQ